MTLSDGFAKVAYHLIDMVMQCAVPIRGDNTVNRVASGYCNHSRTTKNCSNEVVVLKLAFEIRIETTGWF